MAVSIPWQVRWQSIRALLDCQQFMIDIENLGKIRAAYTQLRWIYAVCSRKIAIRRYQGKPAGNFMCRAEQLAFVPVYM